jgi:hypothetical protein
MAIKVFVSYSHDSKEHMDRVLDLADRLRDGGIDAEIDQYEAAPSEGWPRWMMDQLEEADFVLMVFTAAYERRFRRREEPGKGLGAVFESNLVINFLYENAGDNPKFIPVVFSPTDAKHIPLILRGAEYYSLSSQQGYEKLCVRILGFKPEKRPLGEPVRLSHESGLPTNSRLQVPRTPGAFELVAPKGRNPYFPTPVSAQGYAVIALSGLVLAAVYTSLYAVEVPVLVRGGTPALIFVLLLIPWGLCFAAFLFGALRSYARFTYRHLGNLVELGGPVLLFCLVLLGGFAVYASNPFGFHFVPTPPTFDLTVRPYSADGHIPIIGSGKIIIDFETDRRTESIGSNGEADFKGVPQRFRGTTVRVLPRVDGYEEQWQLVKLNGNVLNLPLERIVQPTTLLTGSITPPPAMGKTYRIIVSGQNQMLYSDSFGRFQTVVSGRDGDAVRIQVYADARLVYEGYQVLPGPATIHLRRQ